MSSHVAARKTKGVTRYYLERSSVNAEGKTIKETIVKLGDENTPREVVIWSNSHTVGHIAIEEGDQLLASLPEKSGTIKLPCDLIPAGKARNGPPQWWCRVHQCYYGRKADLEIGKCQNWDVELSYISRPWVLRQENCPGGVGVWCALPPAVTHGNGNAQSKRVIGIHVHTRLQEGGKKEIDATFPAIVIPRPDPLGMSIDRIHITPPAAYAWLDAFERGTTLDSVKCNYCFSFHLDLGHFAQTPHKKHLCGHCGKMFLPQGKENLVSNPLHLLEPSTGFESATGKLDIKSDDFYKLEVWPSTPALIWTLDRPQVTGIHVHAYRSRTERVIDETYGEVVVDNVTLSRKELMMSLLHDYRKPKTANMFRANPLDD
jgi:hypothetical protein